MSGIKYPLHKVGTKIKGTRYLAFKSQLLISSGILSMDSILGGGIPVGCIVLIEDEELNEYSQVLMKYFYAEGYACQHSLCAAFPDPSLDALLAQLPVITENEIEPSVSCDTEEKEMEIAFMYQKNPVIKSTPASINTNILGHNFDLSSYVKKTELESYDLKRWPKDSTVTLDNVIQDIEKLIEGKTLTNNVLRIGIHELGNQTIWPDNQEDLPKFMYKLRMIVQRTNSVAVVTLPKYLIADNWIIGRIEQLSDLIINLESLLNNPNPLYNEYNGLINFIKFPSINTLAAHVPDVKDWAFKLRRKKFIIEKLHLPPELQTTQQREQDDVSIHSCSGPKSAELDF